jgi:hypothetical protein
LQPEMGRSNVIVEYRLYRLFFFHVSSSYHCHRCGVTELDNRTWRQLKEAICLEMDRRPLGDTTIAEVGGAADSAVPARNNM